MAFSRQASVVLLAVVAFFCAASYAEGVLFSTLPKQFVVTATLPDGGPITQVHTGQDNILVSWRLNTTVVSNATIAKVRAKLCFAKESQVLRAWRKTVDDLTKDKTCLYEISTVPFNAAAPNGTTNYYLPKSIPGAKYLVRVYGIDAAGNQVGFGQTSPDRVANTFTVIPITGRHASIDVAVGVFSVFSVGSLFTFFILENIYLKRKKAV
ncbi:hypothetical protein M758_11G154500 [Ceratodon purpureus]|nr:hypothetical protein M758_11G154500 [Ceratodon purpureus]